MAVRGHTYLLSDKLSFHFLYNILCYRKVFVMIKSNLSIFSFVTHALVSHLQIKCQIQVHVDLFLSFLLRILWLLDFYLGHWSILSSLWCVLWGRLKIHSCQCEQISNCLSTIFWRESEETALIGLGILVKNELVTDVWVILLFLIVLVIQSLFISIWI